jgi:hypothetical protein
MTEEQPVATVKHNKEAIKQYMTQNNHTIGDLARAAGVPRSVIAHMVDESASYDFNPRKMSPQYRKRLYAATKLEIFKTTPQLIAGENVDLSKLYAWQNDLLNWMADNGYNQAMLQKAAKLGQGNINSYCSRPNLLDKVLRRNREALYKITKLESLKGDGMTSSYTPGAPQETQQTGGAPAPPSSHAGNGSIDALVTQVKILTAALMEKLPNANKPETDTELVQRTVAIYNAFVTTLEHYKTRPEAVEQLKQAIPAPNAGYLMSCLNALYSKDAFNKWILQQPMPLEVRK